MHTKRDAAAGTATQLVTSPSLSLPFPLLLFIQFNLINCITINFSRLLCDIYIDDVLL